VKVDLPWPPSPFFPLEINMAKIVVLQVGPEAIRESLKATLSELGFDVKISNSNADTFEHVRNSKVCCVIMEYEKNYFYRPMRQIFEISPSTTINFFENKSIYCFYPMHSQIPEILKAISAAGIFFPGKLLRFAKPIRPIEDERPKKRYG
jgi:hypothetical protein